MCTYLLCARPLSQAPESSSQWSANCGPQSLNLFNLSSPAQGYSASLRAPLPPGPTFFSLYAIPPAPSTNVSQCGCAFEVTGNPCVPGSYSAGTNCTVPTPLALNSSAVTATLSPSSPPQWYVVYPSSQFTSVIALNVTSAVPGSIVAYVREGTPPLPGAYDFNFTAAASRQLWVNISLPSARLDERYRYARYFVLLALNASAAASATVTVTPTEVLCSPTPDKGQYGTQCTVVPFKPVLSFPRVYTLQSGDPLLSGSAWSYHQLFLPGVEQQNLTVGVVEAHQHNGRPACSCAWVRCPPSRRYDVVRCPVVGQVSTVFYASGPTYRARRDVVPGAVLRGGEGGRGVGRVDRLLERGGLPSELQREGAVASSTSACATRTTTTPGAASTCPSGPRWGSWRGRCCRSSASSAQ